MEKIRAVHLSPPKICWFESKFSFVQCWNNPVCCIVKWVWWWAFFSLWVISEGCHILASIKKLIATGKESIIPYLDRAEQCKTSLGGKAWVRWLCAPLFEISLYAGLLVYLQISSFFEKMEEVFHWSILSVGCSNFTGVIQSCPGPFCDQHWGLMSMTWSRKLPCLKIKLQEVTLPSSPNAGNVLKWQKGNASICPNCWSKSSLASSLHTVSLMQFRGAVPCPKSSMFGTSSEVPGSCWHGDRRTGCTHSIVK